MPRGAAKTAALTAKARLASRVKRELRDAVPVEVRPGKEAIERKIEDRKPRKLQWRNYKTMRK
jgi:hypothetical protein